MSYGTRFKAFEITDLPSQDFLTIAEEVASKMGLSSTPPPLCNVKGIVGELSNVFKN